MHILIIGDFFEEKNYGSCYAHDVIYSNKCKRDNKY